MSSLDSAVLTVEDAVMTEAPPTSAEVGCKVDGTSLRLWNPVRDTRSPSEEEFTKVEQAFGRFVNFMKNRDEAGLSPEAVRLLHSFYTELDAATATAGKDEPTSHGSTAALTSPLYTDCPVYELATNISIRRQLEGRHLNVLINLIMMLVEEEQKEVQRLLKFYNLLSESTDDGQHDKAILESIRAYPAEQLIQLKALTQEHIRLKIDFIAKIKTGRSLMVKCLDGSHRLLNVLRKKSAKHIRKQGKQELAHLREVLQVPSINNNSNAPASSSSSSS